MTTNIKKFLENYKLIIADRSEYVHFEYCKIAKTLEICYCIESFMWDDLLIERGNTYLIRKKTRGYAIYELTGLWKHRGHQGHILTVKAVNDGIKGWNISSHCKDYFKIIGDSLLYPFLYSEDE